MYTLLYIHKLYCYLRTDHSPRYFVLPMHSMIPCQGSPEKIAVASQASILFQCRSNACKWTLSKQRGNSGEVCELMEKLGVKTATIKRWAHDKRHQSRSMWMYRVLVQIGEGRDRETQKRPPTLDDVWLHPFSKSSQAKKYAETYNSN